MCAAVAPERMPSLALLAGGFGTRLRSVASGPKALVRVAGEPFIAHQLRLLVRERFTHVVICTGYLGDQIEAFVGDGSAFGCRVQYSRDGEKPLGTGGAIRNALPLLGGCFFVTYGDSYLDTPFAPIYQAFLRSGQPALMSVFRNDNQWDTSNVEFSEGAIRSYDKVHPTAAMHHIDYGIGLFDADVFRDSPLHQPSDLGNLFRDLAARKLLAGYEVHQRFYEIGSPAGLAETDAFLSRLQVK